MFFALLRTLDPPDKCIFSADPEGCNAAFENEVP